MTRIMDGLLTEQELAAEIGKAARTLARWRNLGVGPPYLVIGETIFYRAEAVREWVLSKERQPVRAA